LPYFNITAVIAPENAKTEPTERSIPPIYITSVIPTEIIIFTDICLITFQILSADINLSERRLKAMHMISSAIID